MTLELVTQVSDLDALCTMLDTRAKSRKTLETFLLERLNASQPISTQFIQLCTDAYWSKYERSEKLLVYLKRLTSCTLIIPFADNIDDYRLEDGSYMCLIQPRVLVDYCAVCACNLKEYRARYWNEYHRFLPPFGGSYGDTLCAACSQKLAPLITMPYKKYLQSPHWKQTRAVAIHYAGYKCNYCGEKENLQVHHNTYRHKGYERPEDLDVVCRSCHSRIHGWRDWS